MGCVPRTTGLSSCPPGVVGGWVGGSRYLVPALPRRRRVFLSFVLLDPCFSHTRRPPERDAEVGASRPSVHGFPSRLRDSRSKVRPYRSPATHTDWGFGETRRWWVQVCSVLSCPSYSRPRSAEDIRDSRGTNYTRRVFTFVLCRLEDPRPDAGGRRC